MKNFTLEMSEFAEVIFAAKNFTIETNFLLNMSILGRTLLLLLMTTSFLVGWIAKVLIYQHIFKTKMKEQPINMLILMEQVTEHCSGNLVLLALSLSLLLNESIGQIADNFFGNLINGEVFCWLFYYIQSVNFISSTVDGLAIAIVRLLYLLKGTWIKYKFGEVKFITGVGVLTVSFISIVACLFSWENIATRSAYNLCMGKTQNFQIVLLDYREVGNTGPIRKDETFWIPAIIKLGVVFFFAELLCYLYFFWYLYQHNNSLSILSQETKRARNKTNAQSFLGQSILFLTTISYNLFLYVAFLPGAMAPEIKEFVVIIKYTEFGFRSVVHCLLVPALRTRILEVLGSFKSQD